MSDYIKVSIKEEGEGWVCSEALNLDTNKGGETYWRYTNSPQKGQKLEFQIGHSNDLVSMVGLDKATQFVFAALARKRKYVIVEAFVPSSVATKH